MSTTIAVVPDYDKKGCYNVLSNYVQRGITYSSADLANNQAIQLSEKEPCDHLILYKG